MDTAPSTPRSPLQIQHVAVVGCGTMGNGIAQVFATCGFAVELVDLSAPALEKAMSTSARNLDRVVAKGALDQESRDAALARIHCGTSLAEATRQADLVVEAATENRQIKLELFRQL
ncbi:MAG: 3-hydroxyacyl-CoA dehydrogenase family protein, partial [Bacteroidota bacterium]